MNNAQSILVITSAVVAFVSWIASTFKSGYMTYSPWSLMGNKRPKYKVDQAKKKQFVSYLGLSLALNILYALAVTRDIKLVAEFSLFNMIFISYALRYLILLKEKDK